ncbi:MAG: hypothetical protein QMD14_00910 [Candidatus Aenigmarchaeota archaeon]|nr:hypothetical protein [Candidatus Aenigmarchaeota archaeon]
MKTKKTKKLEEKPIELEKYVSEGKLFLVLKGIEVLRETPFGKERILSRENMKIPLLPTREIIMEEAGKRKISSRIVRDYINLNFKKELTEIEAKSTKVVYTRGFFEMLVGLRGRKKVVRTAELKNFVLDHLKSTRPFPKDIGVVALAFYLKEFLEVVFDLKKELTYDEIVEVIKERDINEKLKNELCKFFSSISTQLYEGIVTIDYEKSYDLALRIVDEFTKS